MPFNWSQIEPTSYGQASKFDVPISEWIGLKFDEGLSYGLGRAAWDLGEDFAWNTGSEIDPKILNKSFGIPGYLEFDGPMTVGRAYLLNERKKEELNRMAYLESASHSALSGKAVAGFVAGVAGGFANPVDLSTAFIPFVGSSTKAAPIARMGKGLLGSAKYGRVGSAVRSARVAIAEGFMTQEGLGLGRGASLLGATIDGIMSQAAVEVPIAFEKARNKADYGLQDSLFNVLAGGLFAGGLNFAGQAFEIATNRAIRKAIELHNRLDPETKDMLFRNGESAFVEGRTSDVDKIIRIDEEAIRAKVAAEQFDAEAARIEAMRKPEVWDEIKGEVEASVKAANDALASGDINALVKSIQDLPTSTEIIGSGVDLTRLIPELKNLSKQFPDLERIIVNDRPFAQWLADVEKSKLSDISKWFGFSNASLEKIVNSNRPESFKKAAREILEGRRVNESFPYTRAVETERSKRIKELIEKKRQEWKDNLDGRVEEAKRQEIIRQQADGKQLSPEDAAKYQSKANADKTDLEIVKQDVENLQNELSGLTDIEKAELEELGFTVHESQAAAAKAAAPCAAKVK